MEIFRYYLKQKKILHIPPLRGGGGGLKIEIFHFGGVTPVRSTLGGYIASQEAMDQY
jgi:hypothetical protein